MTSELIDLRTINPFDMDTVAERATHRASRRRARSTHDRRTRGEIANRIMEECFLHLEAPVQRVAGFDCIMPYYKLELDYLPDAARIEQAITEVSSY